MCMQAATVTISGKAPDYASKNIVVSTYADYVSRLKKEMLTINIDGEGNFHTETDLSEVTYVFIDLGSYVGYLYLEPGARYEIVLPPYAPRPDVERFNPFYEPQMIEIGLRGASSPLNQAIRDFDRFFQRELARNARRLVRAHDKALADRLIERTDSAMRATKCEKTYFKQHVRYRQAQLYAAPRLSSGGNVLSNYFLGRPVLYNLPAYWDVINMMQPDPLDGLPRAESRKALLTEERNPNPSFAKYSKLSAENPLWAKDRNLREALLLRTLQNNFYSKLTTDGRADTILISAARECGADRNRMIAANIYAKKNKLKAGLPAPELGLQDQADRPVELKNFKDKFLYLCFMHTDNYECLKSMPALENLYRLHRADMEVLVILTNEEPEEGFRTIANRGYSWQTVSFITNQRLIFDYEVKALPTYFLIDPEGCISIAQAPGPTEKVGPAIAAAIRKYQIEKLRGKPQVPRTIYDIAREAR